MLKRHNQLRNTFLRILDLLIAFSAWELAYLLRFHIIAVSYTHLTLPTIYSV